MSLASRVFSIVAFAAVVAGSVLAAPIVVRVVDPAFPHEKHARLFPLCTACHAGVTDTSQSIWPRPAQCASCHDSIVKPPIHWQPRVGPRAGNRRFTHPAHARAAFAKNPADSTLIRNCSACHIAAGAPRMTVQNAVVAQCLECHGLRAPHVDVASKACATCHVRLTDAPGLTRDDIARFPRPESHAAPDFVLGGHGKAAKVPGVSSGPQAVAASCATCHARNLCTSCHVNAAESPVILALALDDRSPVYAGPQPVPPGHRAAGFLHAHGREARRGTATCAVCHARESCATCHVGVVPRVVSELPAAAAGGAAGVHLLRIPPSSHKLDFRERHGPEADARPTSCETCHTRSACLECHRPNGGKQSTYHPQAFLTRHPSAAYARVTNCSECHNTGQFCQSCHLQAGLVATARIGPKGYHDGFRGFSLGHGQAARQGLESCVSCHAERDCTACHSAVGGGFRFNPHGPGFNADRIRAKNPSFCAACHGRAIPDER